MPRRPDRSFNKSPEQISHEARAATIKDLHDLVEVVRAIDPTFDPKDARPALLGLAAQFYQGHRAMIECDATVWEDDDALGGPHVSRAMLRGVGVVPGFGVFRRPRGQNPADAMLDQDPDASAVPVFCPKCGGFEGAHLRSSCSG